MARIPQHTGGDWRLEPIENYQGQPHLVGAAIVTDSVMVAEIRGALFVHGHPIPEHVANAALLSTAPIMRKTLAVAAERLRLAGDINAAVICEAAIRRADGADT